MFRFTALLLIGLAVHVLVAAATPCCCLRAASMASTASAGKARPARRCCGSDKRDPSHRDPARKGERPASDRDCACKAGTVAPAERPSAIEIAPSEVTTCHFVLALGAWTQTLVVPVEHAAHDAGPPHAPSSASPGLLPVLRI